MTDREKKELIEAEETILQLFFDAYERAMKYTKGNINLSLRMAAMLVSAIVHDQTESKTRLYSKEKLHALHRAIQRPDKRQLESLFR